MSDVIPVGCEAECVPCVDIANINFAFLLHISKCFLGKFGSEVQENFASFHDLILRDVSTFHK